MSNERYNEAIQLLGQRNVLRCLNYATQDTKIIGRLEVEYYVGTRKVLNAYI